MKINELQKQNIGATQSIKAIVSKNEILKDKNKNDYLSLGLTDSTGVTTVAIFNDFEAIKSIEIGTPVLVTGTINEWNGIKGFKNISVRYLNQEEYNKEDFIKSYDENIVLVDMLFKKIKSMKEPWKSFTLKALDEETFSKFIECPSAEKYHGNKLRGLFYHTMGMLVTASNIFRTYNKEGLISVYGNLSDKVDIDRIYCKIILHDLGKIYEYEYNTFIRRIPGVLGHIEDGICIIDRINRELNNILTREQVEDLKYSILSHHGQYGKYEPKTFDDIFLHLLDMIDSRVVGTIEEDK